MKTIATFLGAVLVTAFTSFSTNTSAQDGIEQWEHKFPEASKTLGEWVKAHPPGAHYLFEWDGHHPERSQQMVTWAIEHPAENLGKFHAQHRDWPELDDIETTHKEATETFLVWIRNHPEPARSLMAHSAALRWAGDHLYKDYLTMEHPAGSPPPPPADGGIEQWEHRFPEASKTLGEWVKAHPPGAHYIFEWDAAHPERSQQLVTWALEHRSENLGTFHAQHRDWPELDEIEKTHKEAMETFLVWCRNHDEPARSLMAHPAALRWAGDHLYKDYLTMEHPAK